MILNLETINLKNIYKQLIILLISTSVSLFVLTFSMNIPHMITNQNDLVNEYYINKFPNSFLLDLFFIFIYLLISGFFMKMLTIKKFYGKLLVVVIATALLTTLACYYFLSKKLSDNFFSKWFHTVKYEAVIYDVILLLFTYLIFLFLKKKFI